jgi:hypothetical protein
MLEYVTQAFSPFILRIIGYFFSASGMEENSLNPKALLAKEKTDGVGHLGHRKVKEKP